MVPADKGGFEAAIRKSNHKQNVIEGKLLLILVLVIFGNIETFLKKVPVHFNFAWLHHIVVSLYIE